MEVTLIDGGTTSTTGGTGNLFSESGKTLNSGKVLVDSDDTDFFTRPEIQLVSRMPSLQSDGEWSKQKTSARYVVPYTLDSGKVVYNLVRVETEIHPEASSILAAMRDKGAQLAIDSELDAFYTSGSLS